MKHVKCARTTRDALCNCVCQHQVQGCQRCDGLSANNVRGSLMSWHKQMSSPGTCPWATPTHIRMAGIVTTSDKTTTTVCLHIKRKGNKKKRKRKDGTFWHQFKEKASIIPGCPCLHVITTSHRHTTSKISTRHNNADSYTTCHGHPASLLDHCVLHLRRATERFWAPGSSDSR